MEINVILQSLLALTRLSAEVAVVVQRLQDGEDISAGEWEELRGEIRQAEADWFSA